MEQLVSEQLHHALFLLFYDQLGTFLRCNLLAELFQLLRLLFKLKLLALPLGYGLIDVSLDEVDLFFVRVARADDHSTDVPHLSLLLDSSDIG